MSRILNSPVGNLFLLGLTLACLTGVGKSATAAEGERTNVHVVVTDRDSGSPIYQARLTLIFEEKSSTLKVKHSKPISYSAKTDLKGRYRFTDIPKGTVRLLVTAERHASFGKDIEIDQDNQEILVKMKKPQPQI